MRIIKLSIRSKYFIDLEFYFSIVVEFVSGLNMVKCLRERRVAGEL